MNPVKRTAKVLLSSLGFELRSTRAAGSGRIGIPYDPFVAQSRLMSAANIRDLTIFDVGANKGQSAISYRSIFPDANIYSFEAIPSLSDELMKNFSDDEKIHVIPHAVSSKSGIETFYVNQVDATSSLLPRPAKERRYYAASAGAKEEIQVDVIDLDGFVKNSEIGGVDIIKLDIQGGELEALHGARELLQSGTVSMIYSEIMFVPHYDRGPMFHEIWRYLSQFGYSVFDIYDLRRAVNGQLRYGDALFVSQPFRERVIDNFPEEP